MIYIILGLIIGVILGAIYLEGISGGVSGGLLGFLVGILVLITIGFGIGLTVPTVEVVEEQEIIALNDSTSIEGRKYLYSGYINENLVCRYVINTERGKHIEEVKSDSVYIKEGDYKPTVITHKFVPKEDWYAWFCIPIGSGGNYTEFFVPENTVTSEYNIDLQ